MHAGQHECQSFRYVWECFYRHNYVFVYVDIYEYEYVYLKKWEIQVEVHDEG